MATFADIERLTKDYAEARDELAAQVDALKAETAGLKRIRLPAIRRLTGKAANRRARLAAAIDGARGLFVKPRTVIAHGVRVGVVKARGELGWRDGEQVIRLIRKHLPDRAEALIKVSERPLKSALAQLTAAELKRIGVAVGETGDKVLIKPADGDIDKFVDALLKEIAEPDEEAAE